MSRGKSNSLKVLVTTPLLLFGMGIFSTPSFAQGEVPYCRQWARDYCASIGAAGNPQCIGYWTMRCEQEQGRAGLPYKLD